MKSDKSKGFRLSGEPVIPADAAPTESKFAAPESPAEAGGDSGELPRSYGIDTLFLMAQEPHWLFTYWDIAIAQHPGGPTFLRYYEADGGSLEGEIEVPFETPDWYIPVKHADTRYFVELGYYRAGKWVAIGRSGTTKTPPDQLGELDGFDYATVPLHLTFQRLLDGVQAAIRGEEDLVGALSRVQRGIGGPSFDPDLHALSKEQRTLLLALLGEDLLGELTSGASSAQEIERRIREHIEERLSSFASSESLTSGAWGSEQIELFHALSSLSGSSEITSWNTREISGWAAGALASWFSGPGLTSWSAGESAGLSSAVSAGWPRETLSSWSPAALSSWLKAETSSWAGGEITSWSAAALSGLGSGGLSSWGPGGESSSWSLPARERAFFMHVNAEVIFYGGTDPGAHVTIDGKVVPLQPDGTFSFHFTFPDRDYEIPIIATSPDGLEQRSATLRFSRSTKKVGVVTDTAQPPLGEPMGARQ